MKIRQGDVLLERINAVPEDFKPKESALKAIVARGEVTGHCHEIVLKRSDKKQNLSTEVFVNPKGVICFKVNSPAMLKHQEHGSIDLPVGTYIYIPQREYTPEEIRNVKD